MSDQKNILGFTPAQEAAREAQNHQVMNRNAFIAMTVLSFTAVVLRFVSRRISRTKLWWDDWLTVLALITALTLNIVLLVATVDHGLGEHAEFAGYDNLVFNGKLLLSAELTWIFAMSCIKIAIILFYYRIFRANHKFVTACWILGTVTTCWFVTSFFIAIFQCRPVQYLWDRNIFAGECIPESMIWYGASVSSLVTDASILCMPLRMIWKLKVNARQKLGLSLLFLAGTFTCVTSIIRLNYIGSVDVIDASYTEATPAVWTCVEANMAVISACLPTYRPLVGRLLKFGRQHSSWFPRSPAGTGRSDTAVDNGGRGSDDAILEKGIVKDIDLTQSSASDVGQHHQNKNRAAIPRGIFDQQPPRFGTPETLVADPRSPSLQNVSMAHIEESGSGSRPTTAPNEPTASSPVVAFHKPAPSGHYSKNSFFHQRSGSEHKKHSGNMPFPAPPSRSNSKREQQDSNNAKSIVLPIQQSATTPTPVLSSSAYTPADSSSSRPLPPTARKASATDINALNTTEASHESGGLARKGSFLEAATPTAPEVFTPPLGDEPALPLGKPVTSTAYPMYMKRVSATEVGSDEEK